MYVLMRRNIMYRCVYVLTCLTTSLDGTSLIEGRDKPQPKVCRRATASAQGLPESHSLLLDPLLLCVVGASRATAIAQPLWPSAEMLWASGFMPELCEHPDEQPGHGH